METKKLVWSVALLIVLVIGVNPGSAILMNGSFEDPILDPGVDRSAQGAIPYWTAVYSYVAKGSLYGGAPDGNQLIEVIGYAYQNTGIQMVAGMTYTLTFSTRDKDSAVNSNNIGMLYATDAPPSITLRAGLANKWVTTGTDWASGQAQYTCDATNAGRYLLVILTTGNYSNWSLFDNVIVTSVPPAPAFSPDGGHYTAPQTVSITCAVPEADIRYTTDGTAPNASSTLYSGPITVDHTMTLKASAWVGGSPSPIKTAIYDLSGALLDGSFEDPVLGAGVDRTSTITYWVNVNLNSRIAKGSLYGGAPDGSQLAEVCGYLKQNTGIQLVTGTTYTLTFETRDKDDNDTTNVGFMYATDTPTNINGLTFLAGTPVATGTSWASGECQFTCAPEDAGKYLLVILYNENYNGYSLFDKVAVTSVPLLPTLHPSDFGKKWVRGHDFNFFADYGRWDPMTSAYKECGFNFLFTASTDIINQAPNYQLGKHVYLPYQELNTTVVNKINATSVPTEDNGWYVSDEATQAESLPGIGRIANWLRQNRPNGLVYVDLVMFLSTDAFLETLIDTIHPDVLMYDLYPFEINGAENTNGFFTDLKRCRAKAQQHGLPYFSWLQAFAASYYSKRMPSESEMRMQLFATLAAGCKGIGYEAYNGPVGYGESALIFNGVPTPNYYYVQSLMPEAKNLGRYLRFLESTDYRFVPGPGNTPPDNISNWSAGAGGDPHITSITVNSSGTKKDGLIGLFTDDSGNHYFLFMNMYRDPSLDASSTTLSFTLTFDSNTNQLYRIRRDTGLQETISLSNHQLTLSLPGGTGDLFSYSYASIGFTMVDLVAVLNAMDTKPGDPGWNAAADIDHDGEVTSTDLSIVLSSME